MGYVLYTYEFGLLVVVAVAAETLLVDFAGMTVVADLAS